MIRGGQRLCFSVQACVFSRGIITYQSDPVSSRRFSAPGRSSTRTARHPSSSSSPLATSVPSSVIRRLRSSGSIFAAQRGPQKPFTRGCASMISATRIQRHRRTGCLSRKRQARRPVPANRPERQRCTKPTESLQMRAPPFSPMIAPGFVLPAVFGGRTVHCRCPESVSSFTASSQAETKVSSKVDARLLAKCWVHDLAHAPFAAVLGRFPVALFCAFTFPSKENRAERHGDQNCARGDIRDRVGQGKNASAGATSSQPMCHARSQHRHALADAFASSTPSPTASYRAKGAFAHANRTREASGLVAVGRDRHRSCCGSGTGRVNLNQNRSPA